ncbi:MAG TPA: GspH/FimT family pseudopilin [Nevskiaceae bacterium]|nr:GspH/FimT family pseudopilin [Nevskiaceae bacterium]
MNRYRRPRGFTLVELMVALAVLGIVAALATPSFLTLIANNRLKSAAEQIRSDIALARSEAVKRNQVITLRFTRTSATQWCYGLRAATACDCTETTASEADYCFLDLDGSGNRLPAVVSSSRFGNIQIEAAPFGTAGLSFSPVRPTLTSGGATLSSPQASGSLRITASGPGRVRFCTPSGQLSGYPSC